ncbi:MAG: NAD(P)/FAD-dependent oxidoreductase [Flavobacteriia bacterium]|nr:NAD(P)/FAD-dependent oxidoreductase [Flavobacteriia bacterium]
MKVAIIGAGVSGLCAGSYLLKNGFDVEIFEKHSIPGGLCTNWKKGDYTINGSLHYVMGSDIGSSFYKMWSEIIDIKKLQFHHHDEWLEIETEKHKNKYNNHIFKLYTNINKLEEYLLDLAPEDKKTIRHFIQPIRQMQKFDLPPVMDKLPFFSSFWRGIKMIKYLEFLFIFLKYRKESNLTLAKKFKNPFLKESFELLYDGDEVNVMVFQVPLSIFDRKSAGYPIGGSQVFSNLLEKSFLERGGKIHYKTPVKKIIVENSRANGIEVRNNEIHTADIVLSCCDWKFSLFHLLEGKFTNEKIIKAKNLEILPLYFSIIQIAFGVSKSFESLAHYFRFPIENPILSPDGTVYTRFEIHNYSYDTTLAPKGKTLLVVSFSTNKGEYWINNRKNNRKQYREDKENILQQVKMELDKKLAIIEFIEMIDVATPATYFRYTYNWNGSIQGWMPGINPLQKKPSNYTIDGLKNFYMASHWNQPGGGVPVAVSSAREVCQMISKNHKF